MNRSKYQIFPSLLHVGREALKASITHHGVENATIWDDQGNLLDGWERESIREALGITCPKEVRQFETEAEKFRFILAVNAHRRPNLNRKQKREVIEAYLRGDPGVADNMLGDTLGVSKNTVLTVRRRLESSGDIRKVTETRGKDGKLRPVKYSKRIITNSLKEFEKAKEIIKDLPSNCAGKTVDITTAKRFVNSVGDEQEAILDFDEKAILQAAKVIKARHAEKRAEYQDSKTVKPQNRPRKERLRATRLIHGDCRTELTKLKGKSVDLILIDPIYPEIEREYGRITEEEWHDMMKTVVLEGRRILKPTGSMVIILQPNFEKIGKMRLWLWEFVAWAGREWNLVEDVYWWNFATMPTTFASRKHGLLRPSVKMCVWLGPPDCYRNQENVLWLPCDQNFAETKSGHALRTNRSGHQYRMARITETVEERGGSTPFNLIPITGNGSTGPDIEHPATTPYDLAAWWVKYLLPQGGVLLDCFAGSGTMLAAGLDFGASKVIGIEQQEKYLKMARKRVS